MKKIIMALVLLLAFLPLSSFSSDKQRVSEAEAAIMQLMPEIGSLYFSSSDSPLPEGCVTYSLHFNSQGEVDTFSVISSDAEIRPFIYEITELIRSQVAVSPAVKQLEPLEVHAPICFSNQADPQVDLQALMGKRRNGVANKEWLESLLDKEQEAQN